MVRIIQTLVTMIPPRGGGGADFLRNYLRVRGEYPK